MTITQQINEIAASSGLSAEEQARIEVEAKRLAKEEETR